jgi:hypothetical protein
MYIFKITLLAFRRALCIFFKPSIVSKTVSFYLVIGCRMKFTIGEPWSHNAGYVHEVLYMNLLHAHVLLIKKKNDGMKWELLSCI